MKHRVEVEFEEFGWRELSEAAEDHGVSVQAVIQHAAMYYLASADKGLISHHVIPIDSGPAQTAQGRR